MNVDNYEIEDAKRALQSMKYCLEYMVTGVHLQRKQNDCEVCNLTMQNKWIYQLQEEERLRQESIMKKEIVIGGQGELPDENELENVDEFLLKQIDGGNDEQQVDDSWEQSVSNQFSLAIKKIITNKPQIRILIDNTMGQLIRNGVMNKTQLACLSISKALDEVSSEQEVNIIPAIGAPFSPAPVPVNFNNIDKIDQFMSKLKVINKKDVLIKTVQACISDNSAIPIIVLTDFTSGDISSYSQEAQKLPQIHVISFNFQNPNTANTKNEGTSVGLFNRIANESKGSFTTTSLEGSVQTTQY